MYGARYPRAVAAGYRPPYFDSGLIDDDRDDEREDEERDNEATLVRRIQ